MSADLQRLLHSAAPPVADHVDVDRLVRAGRRRRRLKRAGAAAAVVALAAVTAGLLTGGDDTIEVVDTPAGVTARWERLPAAPMGARRGAEALVDDGRVVVFGGFQDRGDSSLFKLDGAVYVPGEDRWEAIGPAPLTPRHNPVVRVADGELLVFGGEATDETGADATGDGYAVEVDGAQVLITNRDDGAVYDLDRATWTAIPAVTGDWHGQPRLVSWDGMELVVFGDFFDGPMTSMAGAIVGRDGRRTEIPAPPIEPRTSAVVAWDGERLFVWGGARAAEASGALPGPALADGAVWDRRTGDWSIVADGPLTARAFGDFTRPLVVDGRVLVLGGADWCEGCEASTDGAWYHLDDDRWSAFDADGAADGVVHWDTWVHPAADAIGFVGWDADERIVAVVDAAGAVRGIRPPLLGMLFAPGALIADPWQWHHLEDGRDRLAEGLVVAVETGDGPWLSATVPDRFRDSPAIAQLPGGDVFLWGGGGYVPGDPEPAPTGTKDDGWRLRMSASP